MTEEEAPKAPNVSLTEDKQQIVWEHTCNFPDLSGSMYHHVLLPVEGTIHAKNWGGWTVVREEPLNISPSILCRSCGTHGFWRDGKWVPA